MIRRVHIETLLQQSRAAIEIHIRIPHPAIAAGVRDATAQFPGLPDLVAAQRSSFVLSSGIVARQIHSFPR